MLTENRGPRGADDPTDGNVAIAAYYNINDV
jgi:hypothetical protein